VGLSAAAIAKSVPSMDDLKEMLLPEELRSVCEAYMLYYSIGKSHRLT